MFTFPQPIENESDGFSYHSRERTLTNQQKAALESLSNDAAVRIENNLFGNETSTTSRIRQNKKYKNWVPKDRVNHNRDHQKSTPIFITDFVINLSSVTLSDDEMNLLNKGLKFCFAADKTTG